jgi:hypothetical protein
MIYPHKKLIQSALIFFLTIFQNTYLSHSIAAKTQLKHKMYGYEKNDVDTDRISADDSVILHTI